MELDNFYKEIKKRLDNRDRIVTVVVEGLPSEGMSSSALNLAEQLNKKAKK